MIVREATLEDKEKWDSFVDNESGSFFHYFDWKYIYEIGGLQYIPLILENKASQIIGILPIVKEKSFLYSTLRSLPEGASGGFVLKNDLTDKEGSKALTMFLKYIDVNYSKGCSTFILKENLSLRGASKNEPTKTLVDNGFHLKDNSTAQLPCTYILELKQPFEDNIWKELWGRKNRKRIREAKKRGVSVIEDKNLQYMDDFINMLSDTFKQLGSIPLQREEVIKRLTTFKNKTKVFVAFLNGKPIASTLCYYTPSTVYWSKMPSYNLARKNNVNRLLLCEAIRDACKNGYQYFEFGTTGTPSLAAWKEHFKGIKVPMRIYEKRYSTLRTIIEKVPLLVKYAWNNKRELIGKVIRGEMS